ncbi:10192_t:CDS:10 [Diversispora eburnea]|uniref:Tripeptidyl-peptidase 2 n=1 Tax=Diversispora eburnea TaxID=1213867 RepID=A0A9N8ZNH5_9GLOM|nr:10192_t:CDS:10 [Diversispora eburnea]
MTIRTSKPIPNFPTHGLLPKEETEAATFIKKYPEYDGRGVVIAILDTGVDPGAVGLQTTTEDKPKIIDIIDCTGSGDVVTKTIVKPTISRIDDETVHVIKGLSGRSLIINPTWSNPSGEFRVGIKRAYEFFPKSLITRLKKERRQQFETKHNLLQAEVQQKLVAWEEDHPSGSSPTEADIATKVDLENRAEALKDMLKNYEDPGIIYDVVTFFDGADWRVVVDVNESGDLRERQYHTFSQEDLLNFSVNIYDEGDTTSIVTVSKSHGTHVASITAAHYQNEPELNGIAPGSQIISLKIGDIRLESMETGLALTRAAISLIESKADLANMSYGEATAIPDYGYFVNLIREEVVGKRGCIFLSSAGNSGPALTTLGAPVGAYVTHSMVQAEYALLESVPERSYTWSSQGPNVDGSIGVSIYAPGGAITSTPLYSLTKSQLMNGTSMSSPNATGCVALLLSGLKAERKEYTPYRIKNALENSSKQVNENFNVGLIQVQKTWDYLNKFYDRFDQDIEYEIKIPDRPIIKRGIYLRESHETSSPQLFSVAVRPKFMKDAEPTSGDNNPKKFELENRIALVCTQPWIRAPDFLLLGSQGRLFDVKVDPTQLSPGNFYFAEVQGYDTTCSERGPLFKVPVTITKPNIITNGYKINYDNCSFGPGQIERRFLKVPEGATFADMTVKFATSSLTSPARLWLHLIQLLPQKRFSAHERKYYFSLVKGSCEGEGEEQVTKKQFSVIGGFTLEICLSQFWSSLGNHKVSLEIIFHGTQIVNNSASGCDVFINGNDSFTRLDIVTPVRRDEINPSIQLDTLRKSIRPIESSLKPLGLDRDVLPDSKKTFALTLTYKFNVSEKNMNLVPRFPAFFDLLYDSYLEGFSGILYDVNKKVIGWLDVYPKNFKLETKGDYILQTQIRHHSHEILEKFNNTICILDYNISKKVNLNVYSQIPDVFASEKSTLGRLSLEKDAKKAIFIGSPIDYSVYPKDGKPGDLLLGKFNLISSIKVDGGQYQAKLLIPPVPIKPKDTPIPIGNGGGDKEVKNITDEGSGKLEETTTEEEKLDNELMESIRDLQISYLKKFQADSRARNLLIKELENNFPNHLPLLITKLELLLESSKTTTTTDESSNEDNEDISSETAHKICELTDELLKKINLTELAQYYGLKQDINANEMAKKKKKENDEKKKAVIFAYRAKAQALAVLSDATTSSNELDTLFEKTWKELAQWLDSIPPISDFKNLQIYIIRERKAHRFGNALKALNKYLNEVGLTNDTIKEYEKALKLKLRLLTDLDWEVWEEFERKWKLIRIPPVQGSRIYHSHQHNQDHKID